MRAQSGEGVRAGLTILELICAMTLLAIVLQGGWVVMARHRTAGAVAGVRAEGLETVRTVAWLLAEEVAGGRPQEDWWAPGEDTLGLRAFRGVGLTFAGETGGAPAEDQLVVCFRGLRSPNPEKDSVLVLTTTGSWRSLALRGAAMKHEPCSGLGGGWLESWRLDPPPGDVILLRLFERGSYHLADGALRYRRGEGGRQPLTPERILEGRLLDRGPWDTEWALTLTSGLGLADSSFWRGRVR